MFIGILAKKRDSSPVYPATYQAVLDYASTNGIDAPSTAQNDINSGIIENLITEGVWDEIDLFYYFKQEAGAGDFAKINWKDPNNFYLYGTSQPSFVADSGFENNDNAKYFKTGYIPSTHATNMVFTNTGFFIGVFGMPDVYDNLGTTFGGDSGTPGLRIRRTGATQFQISNNVIESVHNFSTGEQNGHWHVASVSVGNDSFRYRNGVLKQTAYHGSSGSLVAVELGVLGYNDAGVWYGCPGQTGVSYLALGSDMKDKQSEIYQIMSLTY